VDGHDQRDDLNRIQEAARRGGDLTRQLLAFGRKQMLKVQPLDLNTVMLDSGQMLMRVLGDSITLHLHPEPRPCPVEADRIQLDQVLTSLAANARDAMPRGGALTVSVAQVEIASGSHGLPGGAYVKLEVGDTGSGMDDAIRQRVFEPFFTTKAPGKGSGLGLSTVYGVVKQLGGTVTVESSPLKGSTFSVLLPMTAKVPETAGNAALPELASSGGETVLLVEDDEAVRVLLSNVLRRHGYQVLVADEPRQALSLAARHTGVLDLVLTDVIMPGMSGPEMVALLKAIRPEPAVLYLSGYAGDELVKDGVLPESLAFVQKPISVPQLLQAVKQVLTQPDASPLRAPDAVAGAA
jgi:CheY-like chemotaxis protein